MAPAATVIPADLDASDYNSSADSDFAASLSVSTSDSETGRKARKRKAKGEEVDSGDEGVIEEGIRKRRRKQKGKANEEEEGVGVRLRRRKEGHTADEDKKPAISAEATTVDVDAVWARLNSAPIAPTIPQPTGSDDTAKDVIATAPEHPPDTTSPPPKDPSAPIPPPTSNTEETISIERTYTFAGQTITESTQVPKSSASAHLYLQSQHPSTTTTTTTSSGGSSSRPPLRRPKKRVSMFEPAASASSKTPTAAAPSKLNTIEKSKMDWAGYVDREGIKEELDGAGKAKEGYLGKMDFLGRVDRKREEEIGKARRK